MKQQIEVCDVFTIIMLTTGVFFPSFVSLFICSWNSEVEITQIPDNNR